MLYLYGSCNIKLSLKLPHPCEQYHPIFINFTHWMHLSFSLFLSFSLSLFLSLSLSLFLFFSLSLSLPVSSLSIYIYLSLYIYLLLSLSLYLYLSLSHTHKHTHTHTHSLCQMCTVPCASVISWRLVIKMLHGTHYATYISPDNLTLNNIQWSMGVLRSFGLFDVSKTDLSQQKHPMLDVRGAWPIAIDPPTYFISFN